MWTYCVLMPLVQALEEILFRRGVLVRERAEQQNKVAGRLSLGFENLDSENVPTKVQGSMALGLLFSLLTAQISLNPLSKI